jgi:hypothetical protein
MVLGLIALPITMVRISLVRAARDFPVGHLSDLAPPAVGNKICIA